MPASGGETAASFDEAWIWGVRGLMLPPPSALGVTFKGGVWRDGANNDNASPISALISSSAVEDH